VACQRGWQVTALDVSQVVLERASAAIDAAGVTVRWVHSGLADAQMTPEGFDLVSAQHPRTRSGADAHRGSGTWGLLDRRPSRQYGLP
jgi:hypothetical protein